MTHPDSTTTQPTLDLGADARSAAAEARVEATAADVDAIRGIRDMYRDTGWAERQAEAEAWLAVAEQDHAAAVAGIDYRDLAAMGPDALMPEPAACCGYPTAEHAAEIEAGL